MCKSRRRLGTCPRSGSGKDCPHEHPPVETAVVAGAEVPSSCVAMTFCDVGATPLRCGVDPTDTRHGGCARSGRRRQACTLGNAHNAYSADSRSRGSREADKLGRGRNTRMRIPRLTLVGEGVAGAWPREARSSLQIHTNGEGLGCYSSTGVCRHFTTGSRSRLQQ